MLAISYRRSKQIKYTLENTPNIPNVFWHGFDVNMQEQELFPRGNTM